MIKALIFDCYGVVLDIFTTTERTAMTAYIERLKPDYKLALLSNVSGKESLERKFEPGKLDQLFDAVIASGDVGYEKPAPEIYRLAAEKLDVDPSECVFIDDIEEYVTAASVVGMRGVHHVDDEVTMATLDTILKEEHERTH